MDGQYSVGDVVLDSWTLTRYIGSDSSGCYFEAEREECGSIGKGTIIIITIPRKQYKRRNKCFKVSL